MSSPEAEPESSDMASLMGFASFGNAPRPAKRPRNDFTVIDGVASQAALFMPTHGTNANAIELGPSSRHESAGIDPAIAPATGDAAPRPSQLEALPASLPARPPPSVAEPGSRPSFGMAGSLNQRQGQGARGKIDSKRHDSDTRHQALRGEGPSRQRNSLWYIDYYDPMSNENPWEELEKRKGLEPLGVWLPRGHARQQPREAERTDRKEGDLKLEKQTEQEE
ncbi:hypothetical protein HOO65_010607 [Ceratocystis lukuohia]|uniref:Uncharacterized protein n=1 Tax=Ceratocystis lukuohia TaxID=2019550 RepID=A0ABR4MSK2_9PEZI